MFMRAQRLTLQSRWIYGTGLIPMCAIHNKPARWIHNRARRDGGQWVCCDCSNRRIRSRRDAWKATQSGQLRYYLRQQFWAAKSASKRLGRPFTITLDDIAALWQRQNGRCAITGELMELVPSDRIRNPQKFSLDRIDSSKGYIPGNIQYLCEWANRAKQNLTKEQLIAFAKGVLAQAQTIVVDT